LKQLLGIAIAGIFGVLLLALGAEAAFNVSHGRPIAHVTGIAAVVLRDGLTVAVFLVFLIGIALWQWLRYPNTRGRNPWK